MKRDFEEYLISVQKQYTEMQKAVEEANQLLAEGKMDENTAHMIKGYYDTLHANYQRVLYCRYLYNLPPKFIQALQKKKLAHEAKKFAKEMADKETVVNENQQGLDATKEAVQEAKGDESAE